MHIDQADQRECLVGELGGVAGEIIGLLGDVDGDDVGGGFAAIGPYRAAGQQARVRTAGRARMHDGRRPQSGRCALIEQLDPRAGEPECTHGRAAAERDDVRSATVAPALIGEVLQRMRQLRPVVGAGVVQVRAEEMCEELVSGRRALGLAAEHKMCLEPEDWHPLQRSCEHGWTGRRRP